MNTFAVNLLTAGTDVSIMLTILILYSTETVLLLFTAYFIINGLQSKETVQEL
jgi:hypothetical protein